jgi:curved DNA-binding protein CbpA
MTEEEILARAYFVMGKEAGTSMEVINARYKRLAMVWHSDRFPMAQKQEAEEEMKKINNARDDLKKHFATSHKESGYCACRPSAAADKPRERTGTGQAPGPGRRRTTQENNTEEAEARRRNNERARRAAEDEAAAKAKQAAATAQRATAEESVTSALEQTKLAADEKLRWKVSVCIVIAWIGLNAFGAFSMNAKSWWHDASWKWERDHPSTPPASQVPEPSTPGYVPAYNKSPGSDQSTWQQQQDQDQKRRDEQAESQKKQEIYNTRMAIDRYQKTIEHCTSEIAKVDAQLADPSVGDSEKRKSSSFADAQRGYLAQAQSDLVEAQKRFTELTGRPASEVNTKDWSPTASPTIMPSNSNLGLPLQGTDFTTPASPPVVAPSNLFTTPSTSTQPQPWKPNYLQNPSTIAPFNPVSPSQSVTPYIDKTNPIFKQRTPNLFDKNSGQNP